MRSPWPKSLSCIALCPKVVRAYRPAHRHISRATIHEVLMLVDVLDIIGPRIVAFSGSKERLRLGIAARFLHPAIACVRNNELDWKHRRTAYLQNVRRRWDTHKMLVSMSYGDNKERWLDSDSDFGDHEEEAVRAAIAAELQLHRGYLKQLSAEVRRRPYL